MLLETSRSVFSKGSKRTRISRYLEDVWRTLELLDDLTRLMGMKDDGGKTTTFICIHRLRMSIFVRRGWYGLNSRPESALTILYCHKRRLKLSDNKKASHFKKARTAILST